MSDKQEIIDWLYGLSLHGIKLGLKNITELMSRLGDPQNTFRTIHVAGTDGKGSTCAMIESIIRSSGAKVGLYTSPHISDFNERIEICGKKISDDDLIDIAGFMRPIVEDMGSSGMMCTFFEVTTAIAFVYFHRMAVDYAVIEVGMGGRFDATNIIVPEVSVITNISMEHTQYLGDTISKIAFEKAGIIKRNIPVVTVNSGDALKVIEDVAASAATDVCIVDEPTVVSSSMYGLTMSYKGETFDVGVAGDYQSKNAAMAIEAVRRTAECERFEPFIREGLKNVVWPCRMQKIRGMPLIIDVSHTKAGSSVMASNIARIYGKVTIVFGILADKDLNGVSENISKIASEVVVTLPHTERARPAAEVASAVKRYVGRVFVEEDFDDAMRRAMNDRGDGCVLVTGSLFMAAEAEKWLKKTYAGY
jgi:dihydrofolate synthase/folylpolyglutamate synthase